MEKHTHEKSPHVSDEVARQQREHDWEAAQESSMMPHAPWAKDATGSSAERDVGVALGVSGLVFALFSFFVWPFLFAPVAILLGVLTVQRRAKTLGWWAISTGSAALLFAIVTEPMRMLF